MKRLFIVMFIMIMLPGLAACSGNGAGNVPQAAGAGAEYDPQVDNIDLSVEEGSLRYVELQKADDKLTDEDNDWVFVFDYTNQQSRPAQCQSTFRIQFFQNNVELTNSASYSGAAKDQYELVSAYFSEALKGGTIRFGRIVIPKDDSPITIVVSRNGYNKDEDYQMMTVELQESGNGTSSAVSAEDIDSALQGEWKLGDQGSWYFDDGNFTVISNGQTLSGTYEIDTGNQIIKGTIETSENNVTFKLPYSLDGGSLTLYNNRGEAMVKQ